MKTIALTHGLEAKVDDEDFERLSQFKWYAAKNKHLWYARRGVYIGDGEMRMLGMHRFIMNAVPGQVVDHRDGNTLNNQKSNLRFCTYTQNNVNKIPKRNGSSK